MRGRAALILSVVMGVLAVVMMSVYINSRESSLLQLSAMKDVLVATQDILANRSSERMIQRIQSRQYVQPGPGDRRISSAGSSRAGAGGGQILGTYRRMSETALATGAARAPRVSMP